ncbi:MAG: hypothetical protein ACREGG_04745 [Candidatus Saccharimonadales bacterium]
MPKNNTEEKPVRLHFKSYLKLIQNAVGSNMFRNFYVQAPDRGEFDAFADGEYSCAFFVSAVLVIFKKMDNIHGTVQNLTEALKKSGWQEVGEAQPGDVVVWEPMMFKEGPVSHAGFAIGNGRAVSTSWKKKQVTEHDLYFGEDHRQIDKIYRYASWEGNDPQAS